MMGSNGKVLGPAATAAATSVTPVAARPVLVASASSLVPKAAPSAAWSASTPTAAKAAPVPATKTEEKALGPTHDFLRWMTGALKGLNKGVDRAYVSPVLSACLLTNASEDDIIQMLTSFQLDLDPSTVELIAEMIYANSTTLDGRRFAVEFIAKRNMDATARPKGVPAVPAKTGPVSIADVVRSQPKSVAGNEWGAFKVVNKKKKGGRQDDRVHDAVSMALVVE
jgi:PERQ amino acid-rich with GYF domain-containing protein